jgi:hypothetical protein
VSFWWDRCGRYYDFEVAMTKEEEIRKAQGRLISAAKCDVRGIAGLLAVGRAD